MRIGKKKTKNKARAPASVSGRAVSKTSLWYENFRGRLLHRGPCDTKSTKCITWCNASRRGAEHENSPSYPPIHSCR